MRKITFEDMKKLFTSYNGTEHGNNSLKGVIVISEDTFAEKYSLKERSYAVSSDSKYFKPEMIGNTLFGTSLEGKDSVRLNNYLIEGGWKVDYCYLI